MSYKQMMFGLVASLAASGLVACDSETGSDEDVASVEQAHGHGHGHGHKKKHKKKGYGPGYSLHLEDTMRFPPLQPGSDAVHGRELFGLTADLLAEDPTNALFDGFSAAAGRVITSNGRTCFTCHRGLDEEFGMPVPPVSATVPLSDTLFTGIDADAQGDPRAMDLLDDHALFKYRPNRFTLNRPQSDPLRRVFFWRKSPSLLNVTFSHAFLTDGRGRNMFETDRGAVFSHTQDSDDRFDDLFAVSDGNDLEAFQQSLVTDDTLLALLDESHPMHDTLVDDPFYTVPIQTPAQNRGRKVFEKKCMSCHNMPNVFGNISNVAVLGHDGLEPNFPTHAPSTGRSFNIGVSERNKHGLEFTEHLGGGQFAPIVFPLIKEDGTVWSFTVDMDIGLAATTQRAVDLGRFKVPQLRNIKNLGPYFHDNSADTLEEVIEYFDSHWYNQSRDGKRFKIKMNQQQKDDLLEFLLIL